MTTLPKISIVTASYNQGEYLEGAMRSVLDQNYPNLEYIVMDGGSTDGSAEIIQKYADRLAYWRSEKDRGQCAAITAGFQHATGEICAFLNSDDQYLPWTFETVARIFSELPQVKWLTSRTMLIWNSKSEAVYAHWSTRHARTWFYRGWTLQNHGIYSGWIQQEATFWRRELWEAAGARMDASLYTGGDFELWARFWQHADLVTTDVPLAGFRQHRGSKSAGPGGLEQYIQVCHKILESYRDQTLRNPLAVWCAQKLFQYTRRGGKRFGSTVNWVEYSLARDAWEFRSAIVI
jgi:hypothetical protein